MVNAVRISVGMMKPMGEKIAKQSQRPQKANLA
jgi:hypothetical protein